MTTSFCLNFWKVDGGKDKKFLDFTYEKHLPWTSDLQTQLNNFLWDKIVVWFDEKHEHFLPNDYLLLFKLFEGRYYTLVVGANERRWSRLRDKLKVVADSFKILEIWNKNSSLTKLLAEFELP